MNNFTKAGMLTLALGTVFAASDSNAAFVAYGSAANAPGRCQAFTPGISNTIRNRVVGSENVGSAAIAVACAFEAGTSANSGNVLAVDMWFSNNSTIPLTVNCSLLTGWQGAEGAVLVNDSVVVNPGVQSQVFYDAASTPSTTDTDLGFSVVGVNCTLPSRAVINDTYVYWGDEDGVGV